jgi:uncharacterized protein YjiS (DUF1127 family)
LPDVAKNKWSETMTWIADIPLPSPEPVRTGVWGRCRAAFSRVIRNATEEWIAMRALQQLRGLDDRTLRDMGLTRGEIESVVRWGRRNRC